MGKVDVDVRNTLNVVAGWFIVLIFCAVGVAGDYLGVLYGDGPPGGVSSTDIWNYLFGWSMMHFGYAAGVKPRVCVQEGDVFVTAALQRSVVPARMAVAGQGTHYGPPYLVANGTKIRLTAFGMSNLDHSSGRNPHAEAVERLLTAAAQTHGTQFRHGWRRPDVFEILLFAVCALYLGLAAVG